MWAPARYNFVRVKRPVPAVYAGPGDIVSGAFAWWGLRAYTLAGVGANCCRIRRASDNGEQDFVTVAGGFVDRASITTFLASTTGAFTKFYDQTGNGRDYSQATAANQCAVNLSGLGSKVTADFTASSSQAYRSASFTAPTQPFTWQAVAKHTASGAQQSLLIFNDPQGQLGYRNSANDQVFAYAGSVLTGTASDGAFHSLAAVLNGASSDVNVDGTSNTGNAGSNTLSASVHMQLGEWNGAQFLDGVFCEGGLWLSALNGTQMSNLSANQHTWWGF